VTAAAREGWRRKKILKDLQYDWLLAKKYCVSAHSEMTSDLATPFLSWSMGIGSLQEFYQRVGFSRIC